MTDKVENSTKPAPTAEETSALPPSVVDKYKAAALVVSSTLKALVPLLKDGANVLDLCKQGDAKLTEESGKVYNLKGAKAVQKGIAYPTSLAVNATLCHFSPLPSDTESAALTLKKGDVVKVVLGAHIDGYASLSGETVVVGSDSSSPVTGVQADLLAAAYNAAEAGLRGARVGGKNWEITENVAKVLKEYEGAVKGVEGLFSNQHLQHDIQAKKTISSFPTSEQRKDGSNSYIIEEGEVYHLDVIVTSGSSATPKQSPHATTIFSKAGTGKYSLKMKASRNTYAEITAKAGAFPFTLRMLEQETKARLGVQECVQHGLLKAYEPQTLGADSVSAQVLVTFAVTKSGVTKFSHAPVFYSAETVKPDHEIKDEETKAILAKGLKITKKKTKKPKEGETEAKA